MFVIVHKDGRFYTGNFLQRQGTYPLLWSPYPQQAKRYHKRGWAQRMADRWGGRVATLTAAAGWERGANQV